MAKYVISSGVTSAYDVGSGDTLTVLSGGRSRNSTVTSDGMEIVSSGGFADGDVISRGGVDVFYRGGTENEVTVSAGGVLELADAVVRNGAYLNVGATSSVQQFAGVTLESGATVWSLDTLVGVSGAEYVSSGGVAYDTTVNDGGELVVYSSGEADGATVSRGGLISAAGTLTGTLSDDGEIAYAGTRMATLGGVLTGSGVLLDDQTAILTVSANAAAFDGKVELQEGELYVAATGGLGSATVDFLAGGKTETLKIGANDTPGDGRTYASPLDNFDKSQDRVDLSAVRFVSGATATLAGSTLTLKDGAYTASFTLSGTVSTAYVVSSDVNGGTLIHAKAGAATASLVQAAAAFAPSAASPAASAPSSGSSELGQIAAPSAMHRARS